METGSSIIATLAQTMPVAERAARLDVFLREGARLPFEWGHRDCSLWPCLWIEAERGVDPGQRLRGTYSSAFGCVRILHEAGGLPVLASRLAVEAGLEMTDEPVLGDVGVIEVADTQFLALKAGAMWAVKSMRGIALLSAAPVLAWRI